jgi:hypothetical protein
MSEDPSTEEAGEPTNTPESFEKQQETIAALREQLAQANERDRENRHIIAALTQLIPAIEPPPADNAPGSPKTATEGEGRSTSPARNLSQAGLIFIYTGMGTWAIAVVVASVILVIRAIYPERAVEFFSYYGLPLLLVVASAIFSGCGYLVLRTVNTARGTPDAGTAPPQPPRLQGGAENEA